MKKGLVVLTILALVTVIAAGCAETPTQMLPTTKDKVNFRLLLSDEPNEINNFYSLNITVSKIGLQGVSGNWTTHEFLPITADLTDLIEDNATEIWSGNITAGDYKKVFIYVDHVEGILKLNGEDIPGDNVTVKLPSNKLHIMKSFTLSEKDGDLVHNFIFDITVVKAGKKSDKYILKPQVDQSGLNLIFNEIKPEAKTVRHKEKHQEQHEEQHGKPEKQGELTLEIMEDDIEPGDCVTLHVSLEGMDVGGAQVWINDEKQGRRTGNGGEIEIYIPEDAYKLEIKAVRGKLEGKLEIVFQE